MTMRESQSLRTPTEKSPVINAVLSELAGKDRVTTIKAGGCMTCDRYNNQEYIGQCVLTREDFRDALSMREYTISGMCQECQDSVFK